MTVPYNNEVHWTQRELQPDTISNFHHIRLVKYATKMGMNVERAATKLIELHQNGTNIAEYMSRTIGEDHKQYIRTLVQMGECNMFIR